VKHVIANWKMYPTVDEALRLAGAIQVGLRQRARSGRTLPRVVLCAPFVALAPLRAAVDGDVVRLGAQNCHWEDEGPHTGEISPPMLRPYVDYVLVGHSERRATGETDDQVARKVAAVARAGLVPVLFVGEDSRDDDPVEQTEHRLRRGLSGIDAAREQVLVVYEPTWAIGAEQAAPAERVARVVGHVKAVLRGLGANDPTVVYGGTVDERNIDGLARLTVLDGVGATRASLDPARFLALVDRIGGLAGADERDRGYPSTRPSK